jgi:hypothetical protein
MISDDQIANVHAQIGKLRDKCLSTDANCRTISSYLGAHFCFAEGNANRPDIATNATCAEGLAWRHQYLKKKLEVPDFKVK